MSNLIQLGLSGEVFEPTPPPERQKPLGYFQTWKREHNYHKSEDEFRCCGTCRYFGFSYGNIKKYFKCKLMGESSSMASDIIKSGICEQWDSKEGR